ncbi:MAG: acyl carrier protein [Phycisphaerales bacterium]|nr:acyl carrier protein [Phycisphaerales bacterium]
MVLDQVRACMAKALKLDPSAVGSVNLNTTAADLPGWTSVTHLALVLELETAFKIRFDNDEIVSLGSVEAIMEALSRKGITQ